ncbi:unnamed protein product [Oikopleura dioica]|uniref:Uncharacterized protein n=1 Tax=Oikopleura dioica TaxID=34765 RepID=E4WPV0_OIKDI|nr:unnamed protein product [Oikopleura dioica]
MGLPHHVFGGANRPHGQTSEAYNCATQSTCGKFVAGGNPVNNYHSQEFWARRRFSVNGAAFFMVAFVFLGWFWRGPLGMH